MKLLPFSCAAVLALGLGLSAAHAQPISDADRATARALSAEAHDAFDQKNYAVAADRFARADALVHAPTLLLGLGRAQVGLGKWIAAQETYARIVREGVAPGSPPPFFKALEDARAELDALLPRVPSVTIVIAGGPARVTIDGVEVPSAALGVKRPVDPGDHVVRAEVAGQSPVERAWKAVEGQTGSVELRVAAAPSPPIAPPPQAKPAQPVQPPPVAPVAPPPPPPAASGSPLKTLGIVALAAGAAGLGLGAATGIAAIGKHKALADACTLPGGRCPPSEADDLSSYSTMGALSTAGFIAGGVLAAGGVVLLVAAPKAKPRDGAWVEPLIGPGFAGARGAF